MESWHGYSYYYYVWLIHKANLIYGKKKRYSEYQQYLEKIFHNIIELMKWHWKLATNIAIKMY